VLVTSEPKIVLDDIQHAGHLREDEDTMTSAWKGVGSQEGRGHLLHSLRLQKTQKLVNEKQFPCREHIDSQCTQSLGTSWVSIM
jgi:hypothetical protein